MNRRVDSAGAQLPLLELEFHSYLRDRNSIMTLGTRILHIEVLVESISCAQVKNHRKYPRTRAPNLDDSPAPA